MSQLPGRLQFSPLFRRQLKKVSRQNPKLIKRIYVLLDTFLKNPYQSRLKTHKLAGNLKNHFSFSVDYHTRIVFAWKDQRTIVLISIGSHDQVYRLR